MANKEINILILFTANDGGGGGGVNLDSNS